MLILLAETAAETTAIGSWANLGAVGLIGALLVWMITQGFPKLMDKHEVAIERIHTRFDDALTKMDVTRSNSAREGHDAAKQLSASIDKSTESNRENTRAVEGLTRQVSMMKNSTDHQ